MFEIDRRIVLLNGIDTHLLSIEGKCSIEDSRINRK